MPEQEAGKFVGQSLLQPLELCFVGSSLVKAVTTSEVKASTLSSATSKVV